MLTCVYFKYISLDVTREKAPGGLRKVLFLRVNQDLLTLLRIATEKQRKRNPGYVIAMADVARDILYEGLSKRVNVAEEGELSL